MAAASRNFTCVPDTDIDPLSCLTTTLFFQLRDNIEFLYEYIGAESCIVAGGGGEHTPDTANIAHDHDGVNSALTFGQLILEGQDNTAVNYNTPNVASGWATYKTITINPPTIVVLPNSYRIFVWAKLTQNGCNIVGGGSARKWTNGRVAIGGTPIGEVNLENVARNMITGNLVVATLPVDIQIQFRTIQYFGANCLNNGGGRFESIMYQVFKES